VRATFGDVPVAGFLTYGEIARYRGRLDGWHNATAVVAAIPA
jgi:small ligand-binding sensory domain FIST